MRLTVTTYSELDNWVNAWIKQDLHSLVVLGNGGLQKTTTVCDALERQQQAYQHIKGGSITAAGLYQALFMFRTDNILVLDDVDGLQAKAEGDAYLKGCLDTRNPRIISRYNARTMNRDDALPPQFTFHSKVCIIMNEWRTKTKTDEAIVDRVIFLDFAPDALELHKRVATWGPRGGVDEEVYHFVGQHLGMIPPAAVSMRPYVVASQVKRAGMDWRDALLKGWGLDEARVLLFKLQSQPGTERDKIAQWVTETGLSRPTYFRYKKQMGL